MEVFILSFSGDVWNNIRNIGEEREFIYIYLQCFPCVWNMMGGLSLVAAHDELIVYTIGVSNDYGWVAHIIRDIVAMESILRKKLEERKKECVTCKEWMGMSRDKWGDYY